MLHVYTSSRYYYYYMTPVADFLLLNMLLRREICITYTGFHALQSNIHSQLSIIHYLSINRFTHALRAFSVRSMSTNPIPPLLLLFHFDLLHNAL